MYMYIVCVKAYVHVYKLELDTPASASRAGIVSCTSNSERVNTLCYNEGVDFTAQGVKNVMIVVEGTD